MVSTLYTLSMGTYWVRDPRRDQSWGSLMMSFLDIVR